MPPRPVAIVTGARSGIGLQTARQLATLGWDLTIAARREKTLLEAAEALPDPVLALARDCGRTDHIDEIISETHAKFGRIDCLINNAGFAPACAIPDSTPETLKQVFDVNSVGPAYAIARVWPIMVAQGGGRIVNISSMATQDPFPGLFMYAAAKASVNLMARSVANEGEAHGIRGFSVAPGAVETPMLRGIVSVEDLPTSACLTPAQVADVVVACATGERDGDNGSTILISTP